DALIACRMPVGAREERALPARVVAQQDPGALGEPRSRTQQVVEGARPAHAQADAGPAAPQAVLDVGLDRDVPARGAARARAPAAVVRVDAQGAGSNRRWQSRLS